MNNDQLILQSLENIEKQISEKLTVAALASGVHVSKYHFQRLFRNIIGGNVMEYVTKRKLTLAGCALLESNRTILEIALDFGFESREGFTRSFKSYMGVTPSQYRNYGLSAISQKAIKENKTMTYSKATDEIVRELNTFIVSAKDWARSAREKVNPHPAHDSVWQGWADETDALADTVKKTLDRITSISSNPDEISNRFAILGILDNVAFETSVTSLNMNLTMIGRESPQSARQSRPYCEKYKELAVSIEISSAKISVYMDELTKLIVADMRKTITDKLEQAISAGKNANEMIKDYAFYIKDELARLVDELESAASDEISISLLEDTISNLRIIGIAAKIDIMRRPDSKTMFDGLQQFLESLLDAADFCRNVLRQDDEKNLFDIGGMASSNVLAKINVLLFFFKSETEKMGRFLENSPILDNEQKKALDAIERKIDEIVHMAKAGINNAILSEFSHSIDDVVAAITTQTEKMGIHGGALDILAVEFMQLNEFVAR